MKKIILISLGVIILITSVVFSGLFNEDFGLIRGLRAKHLLKTNPTMIQELDANGVLMQSRITEIENKYNSEISNLMSIRDKARNDFFNLDKNTRDTSEEGYDVQYTYLDAVYKIVILEHQRNMEVSGVHVERYSRGREIRLTNFR